MSTHPSTSSDHTTDAPSFDAPVEWNPPKSIPADTKSAEPLVTPATSLKTPLEGRSSPKASTITDVRTAPLSWGQSLDAEQPFVPGQEAVLSPPSPTLDPQPIQPAVTLMCVVDEGQLSTANPTQPTFMSISAQPRDVSTSERAPPPPPPTIYLQPFHAPLPATTSLQPPLVSSGELRSDSQVGDDNVAIEHTTTPLIHGALHGGPVDTNEHQDLACATQEDFPMGEDSPVIHSEGAEMKDSGDAPPDGPEMGKYRV